MRTIGDRFFWVCVLLSCACGYVHAQFPPVLPQVYANNLESIPTGAWDVTKTIGVDYASTGVGLQQALTDWCAAPDQWWHVINPQGNVIAVTALMTACGKSGATKFFVLDSDTPLTVGQTVCSHKTADNSDGSSPRNLGCTNDKGSMGIIDGNWNAGNNGRVFQPCTVGNTGCPVATNHIAIKNQEIRFNPASTQPNFLVSWNDGNTIGTGTVNHMWLINDFLHADATDTSPYANANSVSGLLDMQSCAYCGMAYSYMDEAIYSGSEGHDILGVWSPGPLKFVHNWVEGSAINFLFGGANTTFLPYVNVFDVEFRGNRFTKPAAWMPLTSSAGLVLKSTGELKTGTRILFDGNIFEYSNTDGGQHGQCMTLNVRDSSAGMGDNYSSAVQDITWTNNICRHAVTGIETDARSHGVTGNGGGDAQPMRRVKIDNNLFYDIDPGTSIIYNNSVTQPWISRSGTTGGSWTCTAARNSAGTQSTITCADGGTGLHQMDMSVGDFAQIESCSDSTFSTGYYSGTFPNKGTPILSIISGLSFTISNPGTANATATGCAVSNRQGLATDYSVTHFSLFGAGPNGIYEPSCLANSGYAQRYTYQNNLIAITPATYAGLKCVFGDGFEGTSSEVTTYDTSTLNLTNNVLVGRTASTYTDYPGGVTPSVANWFPAGVVCSRATADSTCIGTVGMMSGAAYEPNATNYHDYVLHSSSLYTAGGSRQASDGLQVGADIGQIDAHINSNLYVCGTSCGGGPFPDVLMTSTPTAPK